MVYKCKGMVRMKGDPKTKFLRLFQSAVRRPPIRPPIKNFPWLCPRPLSAVRPGANPIKWGQSYTVKNHFFERLFYLNVDDMRRKKH